MEREIVKSIVGSMAQSDGSYIGLLVFVCDGPHNCAVVMGMGAVKNLGQELTKLYDSDGPFKITPSPAPFDRQKEFESLGRMHDDFPLKTQINCNRIRIQLNEDALGIQMIDNAGPSVYLVFDHHSLGELRSMLEQFITFDHHRP